MGEKNEIYKFFTDQVAFKSIKEGDETNYFVEGYASTKDLDLVGDVMTDHCLDSMRNQIIGKNIKLDNNHESWTISPDILPIGKVIDAKVDAKGLWIKCQLNKHSPSFKNMWNSIKDGFVDAFSIAFNNVKTIAKGIKDGVQRVIDDVNLLNIALTGNPANPEARITTVMMKSLAASMEQMEDNKMVDEPEVKESAPEPVAEPAAKPVAEPAAEPVAEPAAEPVVEKAAEPAVEPTAEPEVKSIIEEMNSLKAEMKSLVDKSEASEKVVAELKAKLEAAEKAITKPQLKAHNDPMPKEMAEDITPLQMCN